MMSNHRREPALMAGHLFSLCWKVGQYFLTPSGEIYAGSVYFLFLYPRPTKLEGGYTGFTLSVRLSVCPSVRLSVDDMVSGA